MRKVNKKLGYSKKHSIAVYDHTWKEFQSLKDVSNGITTDFLLNQFMKQRKFLLELREKGIFNNFEKQILSSNAVINADIKSIMQHQKEQNNQLQDKINDLQKELNSFK